MVKNILMIVATAIGLMHEASAGSAPYDFTRQRLFPGFDGKTCKIQPSVATDGKGTVLLAWQNLLLTGSDVFYGESMCRSTDGGKTFSQPVDQKVFADTWEGKIRTAYYGKVLYSRRNRRWFGLGGAQRYENDKKPMDVSPDGKPTLVPMFYTVDASRAEFTSRKPLSVPFAFNRAIPFGQIVECEDGELLIPFYGNAFGKGEKYVCIVVRYRFPRDGDLEVVRAGRPLEDDTHARGICEPSLAKLGDRYFITLRTDEQGLWSESADGLTFSKPQPWRWDDGSVLENYNTQQHWLPSTNALYLAYTRKGANNDHVFRHRAPIFMAKFDAERNCLVRSTERILVPELGARLGNFVCCEASDDEAWLVTAEWMQSWNQELGVCEKYGSDNSLWFVKVRFDDDGGGKTD